MTLNNNFIKENVTNMVSKMVIIRELKYINLNEVSNILDYMKIDKFNIFSIDNNSESNTINLVSADKGSKVTYIETGWECFIEFLTLYILRGGNYIDIKNLFGLINNHKVNIGRGGSQKAHMLSPIDFRLSCYLMAMFKFNYKLISCINTFNDISKDRYLLWKDRSSKSTTTLKNGYSDKELKSIEINKYYIG